MKTKTVKGMIATKLGMGFTDITIRAEKTQNLTTVSLADDKREIFIQVDYKEIEKLVKGL